MSEQTKQAPDFIRRIPRLDPVPGENAIFGAKQAGHSPDRLEQEIRDQIAGAQKGAGGSAPSAPSAGLPEQPKDILDVFADDFAKIGFTDMKQFGEELFEQMGAEQLKSGMDFSLLFHKWSNWRRSKDKAAG